MASIQKISTGYRVRVYYYDENGKRRTISKNVKKERDAKKLARDLERDVELNKYKTDIPTLKSYIDEYIETYRVGKVAQSSVDIDKGSAKRLFSIRIYEKNKLIEEVKLHDENIRIDKVTPTMQQKVINKLFEYNYSISTIKKTNSLMFRAMERAKFDGLISVNPAEYVEYRITDKVKKAEYIPKDMIKPFLADVKRRNIYHYYLFRLIIETGLRVGEACALKLSDFDKNNLFIKVHTSYDQKRDILGNTKTKHHRNIYITRELYDEMLNLQKLHEANQIVIGNEYENRYGFLFVNELGIPISRSAIHNTMIYCSKKILGHPISVHKLRHTHATLLLEANVPMKVIQERLGHQSMEMTEKIYAHVTPQLQEEARIMYENTLKDIF
ncbi:tyrosine-type recombinase/integrase [Macrococcoides canis]|nr:site-specific integrase [Macrococcus canis]UTH07905.1 site-specific integrase [Macrococcus canis]